MANCVYTGVSQILVLVIALAIVLNMVLNMELISVLMYGACCGDSLGSHYGAVGKVRQVEGPWAASDRGWRQPRTHEPMGTTKDA